MTLSGFEALVQTTGVTVTFPAFTVASDSTGDYTPAVYGWKISGQIAVTVVKTATSLVLTPAENDTNIDWSVTGTPVTVTVVASTDIVTLAEVKKYMKIDLTDTAKDDTLAAWITSESSEIESFLGQPVVPRLVTDYLDGDGSALIETLSGRVSSIYTTPDAMSNVQSGEMASGVWTWTDIATTADQIVIEQTNPWVIELLDGLRFPRGRKNIRVAYYAGFATIPGEIKSVCIERVANRWNESKLGDSPRLGVSTANKGGAGQSLGDLFIDMAPRWAERLNKHRTFV